MLALNPAQEMLEVDDCGQTAHKAPSISLAATVLVFVLFQPYLVQFLTHLVGINTSHLLQLRLGVLSFLCQDAMINTFCILISLLPLLFSKYH